VGCPGIARASSAVVSLWAKWWSSPCPPANGMAAACPLQLRVVPEPGTGRLLLPSNIDESFQEAIQVAFTWAKLHEPGEPCCCLSPHLPSPMGLLSLAGGGKIWE
jgi:hypothetical protein